jgi:hypothetical protein
LNGGVFASAWRAGDTCCLSDVVSHGDGDSAEGRNAFGQRIDKLRLRLSKRR